MPAWVYMLKCADGSYYVGSSTNIALRLAQHEAGEGCEYTRHRLPVEIVFSQEYQTDQEAFLRERQIKGWSRAKKEALICGDYEALIPLAKSRHSRHSGQPQVEADHPDAKHVESHTQTEADHPEPVGRQIHNEADHPEPVEG